MKLKTMIIESDIATATKIAEFIIGDELFELLCIELDSKQAPLKISKLQPDIIFLGIEMPHYDGFEIIQILHLQNTTPLIVLTAPSDIYGIQAIKAGVFDYFIKPIKQEEYISLKEKIKTLKEIEFQKFSENEQRIIHEICTGKNTIEISETLHIAPDTVTYHKSKIFKKAGVNTSVQLMHLIETSYHIPSLSIDNKQSLISEYKN